jgi:hypothetical protein
VRPVPTVAAAAIALLLAGCGSAPSAPSAPPAAAPSPAAAPNVPAVPAPAPTAVPAPGAGDAVPAESAGTASWTMPDLVGAGLQEAQDAIQGLTDFGISITTSHDATGQDRQQVSDRNWKVCDQSVPPGATITPDTVIDFGAVKLDESC